MTIANENSSATFTVSVATQTPYTFTLKCFEEGDISITHITAAGVDSTLVLDVDYLVTLNEDQDVSPGGTIYYPVTGAVTTGASLLVEYDIPALQGTDITNVAFYPADTEQMADRLTVMIKQVRRTLAQCLKIPNTLIATVSTTATKVSVVAGKFLRVNAAGNGVEFYDIGSASLQTPADASVTTAKLADASVTTAKLADASITAAKLEITTKVIATRDAAQTIPDSDMTIIIFDTEANDTCSEYNPSNGRFTAATSGFYQVNASALFNDGIWTAGQHCVLWLFKNAGTQLAKGARSFAPTTATYDINCAVSAMVYLAAGDFLTVRGYQSSGAAVDLYAGEQFNRLSIHRVL